MAIKRIDIVHHAHTDFGYTDYPLKARELQKDYVGQAVRHVLDSQAERYPFAWTCETLLPVWDWWQEADDGARRQLLAAVDSGQMDIMGLPFNVTSFLSKEEWEYMMRWIPQELWDRLHITSAMQNDVNGLPRGGMMQMMRKGVKRLWVGPNTYNALPPMPTPSAFRWQMPDGEQLFVWLNASYCDGFFLFQPNWRRGPVPDYSDLRYRPPRRGDIFRTDAESLKKAHEQCLQTVALIEGCAQADSQMARDGFTQNKIYGGYRGETLCVSLTSQWRIDNDPPFEPVRDFVQAWNEAGYQPELRLATATQAMEQMEAEMGPSLPVYEGEWPDWWANGTASSPVELAISRKAKRILRQSASPVFGPKTLGMKKQEKNALYQLCMYDEHTYGSWAGVAYPYSFPARSCRAEKDIYAYRALGAANCLYADRVRALPEAEKPGILAVNPCGRAFHGWLELPVNCIRGPFGSVRNEETGEICPLSYTFGAGNFTRPASRENLSDEDVSATFTDRLENQTVKLWAALPPYAAVRFVPCAEKGAGTGGVEGPVVHTDRMGWPTRVSCEGFPADGILGNFESVSAEGLAPRWIFKDIFEEENEDRRMELGRRLVRKPADYGPAVREENEFEIVYTQSFDHPSLAWGKRILTINKQENRAVLTLRFNRKSNMEPEIYYGVIRVTGENRIPKISNAGQAFTPGDGQLAGSCMDYYAIDGWVKYTAGGKDWLISSRDAALVAFGEAVPRIRRKQLPKETGTMRFLLFDNTWDTNFTADAHGVMEFTFDLACADRIEQEQDDADWLACEPAVLVNLTEGE